jgi:hypothetical protein
MSLGLEPSFSPISFCSTLINPLGGLAYNGWNWGICHGSFKMNSCCHVMASETNTTLPFVNAFALRGALFCAFCQEIDHYLPHTLSRWHIFPRDDVKHFEIEKIPDFV